ncbi:MAG TPA: CRTAC1 family protein [Vicinamibacterales bacterium]|nr:CRTAC1 family protein [Vicinamibacterales bacterium]
MPGPPWVRRALPLIAAALIACGCSSPPAQPSASSRAASPDWFVDRAAQTGLDFVHVNGMSGRRYIAEILGAGVALLDYDNDGDLDVFFVQGQPLGSAAANPPPASTLPLQGRLYRNDLVVRADGTRTLHFTDVTAQSGIAARGYGMGVAAGDYDNDGCVDLYVTYLGTNQLFRNNCDGTFADVSAKSRTALEGWSVPASFFDYDRDGWLDLYVGRYLQWTPEREIRCVGPSGAPDYCTPRSYDPATGVLYHNNRDGTFTDVTRTAGLDGAHGPALGAVAADVDGDGWPDLFVANDSVEDQLWLNQRNGSFRNVGLEAGVALTAAGRAESSMGVDASDIDDDGDEDLFVAEQTGEGHNLFVNDGRGRFEDRSEVSGLGPKTLAFTGFGASWIDVDNDGVLELLVVNGTVQTIERLAQAHDPFPLHQAKQLLRRGPDGRFEDVTRLAGAALQVSDVSRGAAFGDIDNDGDMDVVIANNNGPARLLINEIGSRNHWVGVRLVGRAFTARRADPRVRDMLGARVEVTTGDNRHRWRRAHSDGSYASASDPRVLVGLGPSSAPVSVRVRWPDGRDESFASVPTDRYTTLMEGQGRR